MSFRTNTVNCIVFLGNSVTSLEVQKVNWRMLLYAHTAVLFYVAVYSEHPTDHHYVVPNHRIRFVALIQGLLQLMN